MKLPPVFSVLVLLAILSGCGATPVVGTPSEPPAEPWIDQPSAEWPQLVLTNEAEFEGRPSLHGASSFLAKTASGRTVVASSMHLLDSAGGVEPPLSIEDFDKAIRSWKVFPRTMPEKFLEAEKIGCAELDDHGEIDWLILTVKQSDSPLPATPLHLSEQRVQIGAKVFLVGCSDAEKDCKQGVYVGQVVERFADLFRFTLTPPVNLAGFSGAPILNEKGHVVGVMTVWFDRKTEGGLDLEAGGEDAATVVQLLQQPLLSDKKMEKE